MIDRDMILSCEQKQISMGYSSNRKRNGISFQRSSIGNWPEIAYNLEVQRLSFNVFSIKTILVGRVYNQEFQVTMLFNGRRPTSGRDFVSSLALIC